MDRSWSSCIDSDTYAVPSNGETLKACVPWRDLQNQGVNLPMVDLAILMDEVGGGGGDAPVDWELGHSLAILLYVSV